MRCNWDAIRVLCLLLAAALGAMAQPAGAGNFRFAILGDRTGGNQPGVYEQVWREIAAERPAFVLGVGDTIEGMDDATAQSQWLQVTRILAPYRSLPLYLAAGNHDIWSPGSERLFRKFSGRAPHYSFNYQHVHFTVLDNSRSEQFTAAELQFLENDLRASSAKPVKIIVSHRPSWVLHAAWENPAFELHRLAKKYGVKYVIAGHLHMMLYVNLEGISYLSAPSAGGHLRGSRKYEDGWLFGYILVEVRGTEVRLQIKELKPPHGKGRISPMEEWGRAGLLR
ncbi:MAG TPA: metallophosphoesterase [Bryobacteraceae bacterium]|nr:metallophosphoesterase [Bryobacteraceae bacterium]